MAELDIRDVLEKEAIDTIRFSVDDVVSNKYCITGVFCIACDGVLVSDTDEEQPDVAYLYIKDIPSLIKALQKAQELWSASE